MYICQCVHRRKHASHHTLLHDPPYSVERIYMHIDSPVCKIWCFHVYTHVCAHASFLHTKSVCMVHIMCIHVCICMHNSSLSYNRSRITYVYKNRGLHTDAHRHLKILNTHTQRNQRPRDRGSPRTAGSTDSPQNQNRSPDQVSEQDSRDARGLHTVDEEEAAPRAPVRNGERNQVCHACLCVSACENVCVYICVCVCMYACVCI